MAEQEAPDTSEVDHVAIESGLVEPPAPQPAQETPQEPAEPAKEPEAPKESEEDTGEPKTPLEAVMREQARMRDRAAPRHEQEPKKEVEGEPEAEPDAKEEPKAYRLSQTEWNSLPEKAKKRIGSLVSENRVLSARVADMEPKAKTTQEIADFMHSSGISHEEFADGLQIMRLRKTDPAKAYEALKPIFNELSAYVGDMLPADLQEDVEDGRITQEAARQLVSERNQRVLLQDQLAAQQQRERDFYAASQQKAQQNEVLSALTELEEFWKRTDPDYKIKERYLQKQLAYDFQTKGVPQGKEAALQFVKESKKSVDADMLQLVPKRQRMNPVGVPGIAATVAKEPKTPLEAVEATLTKMRSQPQAYQ